MNDNYRWCLVEGWLIEFVESLVYVLGGGMYYIFFVLICDGDGCIYCIVGFVCDVME